MKFSTRTTYGLRAMIHLAAAPLGRNVSVSEVAQAEGISPAYLERLFARLKQAGLVTAEKGTAGGYRLAHSPSGLNALEIIEALEGDISPFHCVTDNGTISCRNSCNCGAAVVLKKVEEAVRKSLVKVKLSELVKN